MRIAGHFARWTVYAVAVLLCLVGAALLLVQTGWAKNQLRALIVRQANQYLTATLTIDRLEGSLLRGVRLTGINLARDGRTLIHLDAVDASYSIRELVSQGTLIRRVTVTHPVVAASRLPDGRWDLSALVRRTSQQGDRRGPGRPLFLPQVEVADGAVSLQGGFTFGIAHLPTEFRGLNARFSFAYEPVTWRLDFERASWQGRAPTFDVEELSGRIADTSEGLRFDKLVVQTPRSRVLVSGILDRRQSPSILALDVKAERFVFEEWGGIVPTVATIGVEGPFTAILSGPVKRLNTTLDLSSSGGHVAGTFLVDTTAPGWRAAGEATLQRLDLAKWLSRPDDASDITGRVVFDVGMPPGSHFPRGSYAFDGSHARFMTYQADDVVARGLITPTEVQIAHGTATAYGANVRLDRGTIGIDAPFPFTFAGLVNGVDLRQLPQNVPVPHVESTLVFAYDVSGQFRQGFLRGRADFNDSTFLGIAVGDGTTGSIDTAAQPFHYAGEGNLREIDLGRVGAGLNIAWMQEPRYQGLIEGHFHVDGAGADSATLQLSGGGQLTRARLFSGELTEAAVTIEIAEGTLTGSYDGRLAHVNAALAMDDARYASALTGTGRGQVTVRDLLRRSPTLDDYDVAAQLELMTGTEVRGFALTGGNVAARLANSTLSFERLEVVGPAIEGSGSGDLSLDETHLSNFTYDVRRGDLREFAPLLGYTLEGQLATRGRLTGSASEPRLTGEGTVDQVRASGLSVLTAKLRYDATVPATTPARSRFSADGTLTFVEAFGQTFTQVGGTAAYDAEHATIDVTLTRNGGLSAAIAGAGRVDVSARTVEVDTLTVALDRTAWRLTADDQPPRLSWDDRGVRVERLGLADASGGAQHLTMDGTWYPEGGGSLHLVAQQISLDALSAEGAAGAPARYGGTLTADATITGSRARPLVAGSVSIVDGRIWRTAYEQLAGTIGYSGNEIILDLRLDQSAGIWLTAKGRLPDDVLTAGRTSERPINVEFRSSNVSLGLLEGVTDVIRNVSGQLQINVTAVGSLKDPHFTGRVEIADAAFLTVSSGARYRHGRVALQLASDQVTVESLHLEDQANHALDVTGALATHELRVSNLQVAIKAKGFEVLHNEYGRMDIDAELSLLGQFESPRLDGRITVTRGELQVDSILDRTLFRPYSTAAAPAPALPNPDAIVALNPWDRLGIGIELHVPGTLRMVGENIQVSPGTPLGLGAINLRAIGDLYLSKDPAQVLYVTGSLDQVTGTYSFQGRRFDLDPVSSINFRGDFNPDLYVTVQREISGVATRVTIQGPLAEPELRLTSTPPLDPSDILSLIVFNTSTNQLTSAQQQQLAGRAATIAAGFFAAPILTAIEQSLGLDTLEIAPSSDASGGTRVTIGNEIAPGLVARFSRQFGSDQYDEATIEYFLSRLFRLRASFSDASSLGARSPFRRVERAGIDFLVFFSF